MVQKRCNIPITLVLLFCGCLLLSGCISVNYQWQHPEGLNEQARQEAVAACRAIADEEIIRTNYFYYSYPLHPFPPYGPYYSRNDRYFYWPHYYHYNSMREFQGWNRYFRICMKAKGWKLVSIDKPQPKQ